MSIVFQALPAYVLFAVSDQSAAHAAPVIAAKRALPGARNHVRLLRYTGIDALSQSSSSRFAAPPALKSAAVTSIVFND